MKYALGCTMLVDPTVVWDKDPCLLYTVLLHENPCTISRLSGIVKRTVKDYKVSKQKIKLQNRPLSKNELPTPSDGWERSNQSCLAKMTKWSIYKLQSGFWDFPYKTLTFYRTYIFLSDFKMLYLQKYETDFKNFGCFGKLTMPTSYASIFRYKV